jgi:hypothetical protein
LSPKDAIMRSYALLFCALVVIIEVDWRFVVNKIRFVDWWVLRGLFYTFVGFITCKNALAYRCTSILTLAPLPPSLQSGLPTQQRRSAPHLKR